MCIVMFPKFPKTKVLFCFMLTQFVSLIVIYFLLSENTSLNKAMRKQSERKQSEVVIIHDKREEPLHGKSFIPENSSTPTKPPRDFSAFNLTFVLFNQENKKLNESEIKRQAELKGVFSSSPFICSNGEESLGKSLNSMISLVKTEYFLVLEARAMLSDKPEEGIAYLWNALEKFPELDFVGGSYLSNNKFHVPCRRFRLCKWTFSESYEYERSLDNVMICDGISSSFMGRTDSVRKVKGGFDPNISELMVVKDFFLRAKTSNITVGIRPNVVFLVDHFESLHHLWNSRNITKELVPFAIKHKVFKFKNIDGKVIDICSATSPLSGKGVCIERNSHKLMLAGGHWAYKGLFAYPYMLKYLEITLSEISEFFNRHNVSYFVYGGVALGAIKMRSILPWEAGDIDIIVHEMTLDKLYNLLRPLAEEKGYVVKKHGDSAVHVFCTQKNVGSVSGGLATIVPHSTKAPKLISIQTNGVWISYRRDLVFTLMKYYGNGYLEHKLYGSSETIECKIKGHNACLPNFKTLWRGKAGNFKELFCEI